MIFGTLVLAASLTSQKFESRTHVPSTIRRNEVTAAIIRNRKVARHRRAERERVELPMAPPSFVPTLNCHCFGTPNSFE